MAPFERRSGVSGGSREVSRDPKRVLYKETLRCPFSVLAFVSLLSTATVDILVFIFAGFPKMSMDALNGVGLFSMAVFVISFIYSRLRYRIVIKVSRGWGEEGMSLSLRGVGKGSRLRIPIETVVSCRQGDFSSPARGVLVLLLIGNVFAGSRRASSTYPLPGYRGTGVHIGYRRGLHSQDDPHDLLIPTNNPKMLCELLKVCRSGGL